MPRFAPALLAAAVVLSALTGCAPRSTPTPACDGSMRTAAAFTDRDDDSRLLATLTACADTDDWLLSIQRHLGVGTVARFQRHDALVLLEVLCSERHGGPVCTDAEQRGDIEG